MHLASYPVDCYELVVRGSNHAGLRGQLAAVAKRVGLDLAVQRAGLHRRAKHLVVMDADSTLLQDEVIDLLADACGCAKEVSAITEAAMAGEIDFGESLRRRVALLAGLPESVLDDVRAKLRLAPGARTLLRTLLRLGYVPAVVSGGFVEVLAPLMADLHVDYLEANRLEIKEGVITGRLAAPIVDRAGKARALERFAREVGVPLEQTVAVGDGANDIDMFRSPASELPLTPSRWFKSTLTRPSRCPIWTRCCISWASVARRSTPINNGTGVPLRRMSSALGWGKSASSSN